jgi:hypothetical protein
MPAGLPAQQDYIPAGLPAQQGYIPAGLPAQQTKIPRNPTVPAQEAYIPTRPTSPGDTFPQQARQQRRQISAAGPTAQERCPNKAYYRRPTCPGGAYSQQAHRALKRKKEVYMYM